MGVHTATEPDRVNGSDGTYSARCKVWQDCEQCGSTFWIWRYDQKNRKRYTFGRCSICAARAWYALLKQRRAMFG